MPIRLNLLAEVQAAEEMRRRDPLKRAIWVGALLVAGMLAWSSKVWVSTMVANSKLRQVEQDIARRTNEFRVVLDNKKKADDIKYKLGRLRQLASSRFLNGTMLNALQQSTVPDVALTRVAVKQEYFPTEEIKPKTNSEGRIIIGKPATVRESVVLTLDARDSGPVPGDQIPIFKETLATNAYFAAQLGRTNEPKLLSTGSKTTLPDGPAFLPFVIECRYPDKTR